MENTLEYSRSLNTKEQSNDLEDRIVEISQLEQQNKKRISKNEDSLF